MRTDTPIDLGLLDAELVAQLGRAEPVGLLMENGTDENGNPYWDVTGPDVTDEDLEAALAEHAPVVVTADTYRIPADNATPATVSYYQRPDRAPAQIAFTVNGQAVNVATTDGVAELEVTSGVVRPIEVVVADQTTILIEAV